MLRLAAALAAFFLLMTYPGAATEAGWALMRNGGQVVFLANANAPGSGDPSNFDIENCRTQRNLSDRGRQQARRIGALMAARAGPVEQVYSSRYCRALETARLAFGDDEVEIFEALDSLPDDEQRAADATRQVLDMIRSYTGSGNLILVTHPENIMAMVGTRAREGEAVIVAPGEDRFHKIGSIVFN
ncbi:histidine phosphatase family protein [Mesorhizobium sp. CAU 1741]|uniref:histidine phosphatase family protein n=1 Tax=Mesorhizobium sp. CAU 1741 TaxID=3140366 RepID=UPI00325AA112